MPHFRALSGAGMGFIQTEGMAYGRAMNWCSRSEPERDYANPETANVDPPRIRYRTNDLENAGLCRLACREKPCLLDAESTLQSDF